MQLYFQDFKTKFTRKKRQLITRQTLINLFHMNLLNDMSLVSSKYINLENVLK